MDNVLYDSILDVAALEGILDEEVNPNDIPFLGGKPIETNPKEKIRWHNSCDNCSYHRRKRKARFQFTALEPGLQTKFCSLECAKAWIKRHRENIEYHKRQIAEDMKFIKRVEMSVSKAHPSKFVNPRTRRPNG